jgi:plasmid replication initiation protein/transcriptional regulator of met regulon
MNQTVKKAKQKKGKVVSLIRKSNNLIEAKYNFDVWEMRLFLMLISQIRRDDQDFGTYRIYYRDVAKTFGLNLKRGYAEIRESAKSLLDKKFYVDTVQDGFQRQDIYHIIRKINVLKEGQDGKAGVENQEYIDVKIEDEMKPLLLQLQKSFTTYDFANITNLGLYAIRVYELLKQYESIGHRTLAFDEMKKMFELEDKYPLFSNFFAKVINPSVKEINKYTDLYVTKIEQIKEGKRIVAIRFDFKVQKQLKDPLELPEAQQVLIEFPINPIKNEQTERYKPSDSVDNDRFAKLYPKVVETLGITSSVFIDLIKIYTDEQFEQAIRVTHRAKIEGLIKTNISGFFVQALKNNYTDQKEERLKKEKKEDIQNRNKQLLVALEIEKQDKIFERIKELTTLNPAITAEAIKTLKFTEGGKKAIEAEETKLERKLDVEDFRQIKNLRTLIIDTIFIKNIASFTDILKAYEAQVNQLQE